jgi:predicted dehydrogenase
MSIAPLKLGIVGCGKISNAYFTGCRQYPFLEIVACADLDVARAEAKAAEHGGGVRGCSVDELLADPAIELVINLTIPQAHVPVNLAALRAGKHVYVEKPFALDPAEGATVLAEADRLGLRVGCAPDTFLGGGIQTARKLVDDGAIGAPVAAFAFMLGRGHETWHPSPEFYYKPGGGPMLDMGPYYLTALVNLIGPIRRVSGSSRITFPERTITSEPLKGTKITVEVPTHVAGTIDFECGAIGTIVMSFDLWGGPPMPRIALYGTEGTLEVPDPNTFKGPVRLKRGGEKEFTDIPLTHTDEIGRGTGVADMAMAIRTGRPHRASGALGNQVLEAMVAFDASSAVGRHIELQSRIVQPAPLPPGLPVGTLD